jgi:multiple antibiotic resistance protein
MPLIIGPAALTALLMTSNEFGVLPTLIGFAINLIIIFVGFTFAGTINRIIGNATSTAVSKIMYMLLAAIAVMMIRRGLMTIVPQLLGS